MEERTHDAEGKRKGRERQEEEKREYREW